MQAFVSLLLKRKHLCKMQIEYQLKTPPTAEPITLEEAKAWLKVDHNAEDTLIQLMITTARERCESITGLSLMAQQWVAYVPHWPMKTEETWWDGVREGALHQEPIRAIALCRGPVCQIDAVTLFDVDENATIYPTNHYLLDKARDRLVLKSGAPIPEGTRIINPIEITYTTGYELIPGVIKTSLLKLITHLYEHRGDENSGLPSDVMELWRPFIRVKL